MLLGSGVSTDGSELTDADERRTSPVVELMSMKGALLLKLIANAVSFRLPVKQLPELLPGELESQILYPSPL